MLTSRRSFVEKLGLGAGATLLSSLVNGLVHEARGQINPRKRVVLLVQGNSWNADHCFIKPSVGAAATQQTAQFTLPASLAPLAPHRSKALFIDGLVNAQNWLRLPSAHSSGFSTLTCIGDQESDIGGISIDQYFATTLGKASAFKWVGLAAVRDAKVTLANHQLSASGPGKAVPLQCSPREAFASLFGGSGTTTSGGVDAARLASLRRKSVLDFIADDIARARAALAAAERNKLDEYLTSVRSLEDRRVKQLAEQEKAATSCGTMPLLTASLYEDRLTAQFEVASLALACGLTQVVLISSGTGSEFVQDYRKLFATEFESHEYWGHMADTPTGIGKYDKVNAFHAGLIAQMVDKLSAAKEGDKSVFDNTVIAWFNDGGGAHHSNRLRMPVVVVGNAGGGLRADGRYVKYPIRPDGVYESNPPNYRAMADFYITLSHALGVPNDTFGKNGLETVKGVLQEIV